MLAGGAPVNSNAFFRLGGHHVPIRRAAGRGMAYDYVGGNAVLIRYSGGAGVALDLNARDDKTVAGEKAE